MYRLRNQAGFGHIAAAFVVAFLAVVGFAGYKVVTMNKTVDNTAAATTVWSETPTKISSQSDLTQASKALDGFNQELNTSLDDGRLDADLNSML